MLAPWYMAGFEVTRRILTDETRRPAAATFSSVLAAIREHTVYQSPEDSIAGVHSGEMIRKRNPHSLRLTGIS